MRTLLWVRETIYLYCTVSRCTPIQLIYRTSGVWELAFQYRCQYCLLNDKCYRITYMFSSNVFMASMLSFYQCKNQKLSQIVHTKPWLVFMNQLTCSPTVQTLLWFRTSPCAAETCRWWQTRGDGQKSETKRQTDGHASGTLLLLFSGSCQPAAVTAAINKKCFLP